MSILNLSNDSYSFSKQIKYHRHRYTEQDELCMWLVCPTQIKLLIFLILTLFYFSKDDQTINRLTTFKIFFSMANSDSLLALHQNQWQNKGWHE